MNIVSIGERRVFYMVLSDGKGGPVEVPVDAATYDALRYLLNSATAAAQIAVSRTVTGTLPQQNSSMSDILNQLGAEPTVQAPEPLPSMPEDLQQKLRSLGFGDEPDPGEMLEPADNEADGDQL